MAFMKAFTNGGGGGDSTSGTFLIFDSTLSGIGTSNTYNQDALEYVSGSLRANYNSVSDITFTSKVEGTLTVDGLYNSSKPCLYINGGSDVIPAGNPIHTTVSISKGDTIRWYVPTYWSDSVVYVV